MEKMQGMHHQDATSLCVFEEEKLEGMHHNDAISRYVVEEEKTDIDEMMFTEWKTELQKTLPPFWQSMSMNQKKRGKNFFL